MIITEIYRRNWFEEYISKASRGLKPMPSEGIFDPCNCCGYPTIAGLCDICEICSWEDEGQDDPRADEIWDGPNKGYSLTEARYNFRLHLSMYSIESLECRRRNSHLTSEEIEENARQTLKLINTFNLIISEAEGENLKELWSQVSKIRKQAVNMQKRHYHSYVARLRGEKKTKADCPNCKLPLLTPKAQQCLECGADWHSRNSTTVHNKPGNKA